MRNCQTVWPPDPPAPIITEEIPPHPFHRASADGRHMLVVMDDFSRYPEVEIVSSTGAAETISKFEKIMATHGLIRELRTDNGPPFNGQEWADYLRSKHTKHRKITPRWPQANGEVERFMRTLLKVVRIAHSDNQDIERALYSFLADYRLTPHSTTGVSPSAICISRKVKDIIPHHARWEDQSVKPTMHPDGRETRNRRASQWRRARTPTLGVGDTVLVRDRHPGSKFRLPFELAHWTITRIQGTMVTATRGLETVTRNTSVFKQVPRGPTPTQRTGESRLAVPSGEETCEPATILPCDMAPQEEAEGEDSGSGTGDPRPEPRQSPPDTGASQRSEATRYHLHDNPRPPQRLRDYDLRS